MVATFNSLPNYAVSIQTLQSFTSLAFCMGTTQGGLGLIAQCHDLGLVIRRMERICRSLLVSVPMMRCLAGGVVHRISQHSVEALHA